MQIASEGITSLADLINVHLCDLDPRDPPDDRHATSPTEAGSLGAKDERSLLNMTMHEWSMLAWDRMVNRNLTRGQGLQSIAHERKGTASAPKTLTASVTTARERATQAIRVTAEIMQATGARPNTTTFNRLLLKASRLPFSEAADLYDDATLLRLAGQESADALPSTAFKAVMGLMGCMEEEPLQLKPDAETFEIALSTLATKSRSLPLSEAVFNLMHSKRYNLTPTPLCWALRICSVLAPRSPDSAACLMYEKWRKAWADQGAMYEPTVEAMRLLLQRATRVGAGRLLQGCVLPELEARPWLQLNPETWVTAVCDAMSAPGVAIPLIRWAAVQPGGRGRVLDAASGPDVLSEALCGRWLSWLAQPTMQAGASDIAFLAMQRIIELRSVRKAAVPGRYLADFCTVMAREIAAPALAPAPGPGAPDQETRAVWAVGPTSAAVALYGKVKDKITPSQLVPQECNAN